MRNFFSKLAPAIKEYLDFRVAMGRSTCHDCHLELFDRFLCNNYPDTDTLSQEVVLAWISDESLKEHNALSYKASAIRLFAKYMGNESYMLPSRYTSKKSSLFSPYIFTDAELKAFFHAADNISLTSRHDPFLKYSIPVLLRFLYTCGLRPNEGCAIKRENICFKTGEALITKTKAHKERIVVMSDDILDMCKKYDTQRVVGAKQSEYFFVRSDGLPIHKAQLRYLFLRCWIQANPDVPANMLPRVRPYDLRHRYASAILQKWLDEGRNIYAMMTYLRAYMGHEDFSETAYYIHILPENLLHSPGVDWNSLDKIGPGVEVWRG